MSIFCWHLSIKVLLWNCDENSRVESGAFLCLGPVVCCLNLFLERDPNRLFTIHFWLQLQMINWVPYRNNSAARFNRKQPQTKSVRMEWHILLLVTSLNPFQTKYVYQFWPSQIANWEENTRTKKWTNNPYVTRVMMFNNQFLSSFFAHFGVWRNPHLAAGLKSSLQFCQIILVSCEKDCFVVFKVIQEMVG